jgi:hypothetical protein
MLTGTTWNQQRLRLRTSPTATVCIDLLAEGALTVQEATAQRSDDGRLLLLHVDWAGHQLTLERAYLPSSNTAAQRQIISTRLISDSCTRCLASGREPLLGGDFNFIADGTLDHLPACQQADGAAAERQQRLGGQLVDIYRHRWPRARRVTRFQHGSAARLDRLYITQRLCPSYLVL